MCFFGLTPSVTVIVALQFFVLSRSCKWRYLLGLLCRLLHARKLGFQVCSSVDEFPGKFTSPFVDRVMLLQLLFGCQNSLDHIVFKVVDVLLCVV